GEAEEGTSGGGARQRREAPHGGAGVRGAARIRSGLDVELENVGVPRVIRELVGRSARADRRSRGLARGLTRALAGRLGAGNAGLGTGRTLRGHWKPPWFDFRFGSASGSRRVARSAVHGPCHSPAARAP